MANYIYVISTDFPNGFTPSLDSGKLSSQILGNPGITPFLFSVFQDPGNADQVIITFASSLSPGEKIILDDIVANFVPDPLGDYVIIESELADSRALQLLASNVNGGIAIESGTGGIAITTTNAFTVASAAESDIKTSGGNLILESTPALVNINGGSGVNINSSGQVNIGNVLQPSVVTVQTASLLANASSLSLNATTPSNLTINTSADDQDLTIAILGATDSSIKLSSQGVGSDSISLNSQGGILLYSESANNHPINIVSNTNIANAVNIDTNGGGGGIVISAGSFGVTMNANGGAIGIANFSAGDVYFGTAATPRVLYFGTDSAATTIYQRFGKGNIVTQPPPTVAISPLAATHLSTKIIHGTPSGVVTLDLPLPSDIVTLFPELKIGDSFDFSVINEATSSGNEYVLNAGAQTVVGNATVLFGASGLFRVRMTNITWPGQTYVLYRVS